MFEMCSQLTLSQCLELALTEQPAAGLDSLMRRILEIDDDTITHQHILGMLKLLAKTQPSPNRSAIRSFAFKYLSDQHRAFDLSLYKECLEVLRALPDSNDPFDNENLYHSSIHD